MEQMLWRILRTSDNGFLITGISTGNSGDVSGFHGSFANDAWVLKIDSTGSIEWQKCLGGSAYDAGVKVIETSGGYFIACDGGSLDGDQTLNHGNIDFWLVKLDFSGNILWEKSYGGDLSEEIYGFSLSPDESIIISGYAESVNNGDVQGSYYSTGAVGDAWVIKLDSIGNLQWQKCVGGTGTEQYGNNAVDALGNIYLIPRAGSFDFDATCTSPHFGNGWLVKLDSTGTVLWDKCYGGSGGGTLYSIIIKDDLILMTGRSTSSDGDLTHLYGYSDAWILLTDTAGNKIFSQSYGGSLTDEFFDARFTYDNKIIAGGLTKSNDYDVTKRHGLDESWLVCVDMSGNLIWQNTYGGSGYEILKAVLPLEDGRVAMVSSTSSNNDGDVSGFHGNTDFWFTVLDISTNINTNLVEQLHVFPQPFTTSFTLQLPKPEPKNSAYKIEMYDINGRAISLSSSISENKIRIIPDVSLASGMYFVRIIDENRNYSFKVIKE